MIPGLLKGILELAAAALGPAHAAILDEEVSKLDKRTEELEADLVRSQARVAELEAKQAPDVVTVPREELDESLRKKESP